MKTNTPKLQALIEALLEAYRQHLLQTAGMQPSTCRCWSFYVREFLKAHFKPKAVRLDLDALDPPKIWRFFQEQAQSYPPARLQALGVALRSFFRFLCLSGRHPQDLSGAIPRIADPGREELPAYLSEAQLELVFQAVDGRTVAGQREAAVLLCLARLGLRAGEVAQLGGYRLAGRPPPDHSDQSSTGPPPAFAARPGPSPRALLAPTPAGHGLPPGSSSPCATAGR